jgi:hypothetical protein
MNHTMMNSSIMQSSITKFLTSPSHVARVLDCQRVLGSILSMRIGQNTIDLAVTGHPGSQGADAYIQRLPSIPLKHVVTTTRNKYNKRNAKTLHPSIVKELNDIVEDWDVCGFVVHWPVQKESGRCGAPCGRVLHTLDQLAAASASSSSDTSSSKLLNNRPVCLWNAAANHHHDAATTTEDVWGRSALYAKTASPEKTVHYASVEQYQDDNDDEAAAMTVAEIAADYMRSQWPEIDQHYATMVLAAEASPSSSPDETKKKPAWDGASNLATLLTNNNNKTTNAAHAPQQQRRQAHTTHFDLSWLNAYQDTAAYCAASAF